jgi:peptidoglycan/LPS O-acetylase OafA/YrhL
MPVLLPLMHPSGIILSWRYTSGESTVLRLATMSSIGISPSVEYGARSSKQGYLPTLDGWRCISIVAVLIDHGTLSLPALQRYSPLRLGPNGVSLFFAISGFLICSRLLEEQQAGSVSLRGFYIRRGCRILPPALVYLAAAGTLGLLGLLEITSVEWWSCVLFFRNYLPIGAISKGWGGYTIHYWSLAVEEHFYFLWPALLAIAGRVRAMWLAGGLAAYVAVWRWWDFRHNWLGQRIPGLMFSSRTDVRLDGLLLGCLAALILGEPRSREWFKTTIASWTPWFAALIYLLVQVLVARHYYTILESVLLALLVASTTMAPKTLAGRFLEFPALKWVGRFSYSLYLWQELFLIPGGRYPLSVLQRYPWNFVATFSIAFISYRYLENPMIRLGHRLATPASPGREDLRR